MPAELAGTTGELGEITADMANRITTLITAPIPGAFAELEATDRRVDAVHAELLARVSAEGFTHGPQAAASLALVGRFYERFADQAVSVARRLEFASTGEMPGT